MEWRERGEAACHMAVVDLERHIGKKDRESLEGLLRSFLSEYGRYNFIISGDKLLQAPLLRK